MQQRQRRHEHFVCCFLGTTKSTMKTTKRTNAMLSLHVARILVAVVVAAAAFVVASKQLMANIS